MNKDQIKGAVKNITGQIQEQTGAIVGNQKQQTKGLHKQISGRTRELLGDAKAAVKPVRQAVRDTVREA